MGAIPLIGFIRFGTCILAWLLGLARPRLLRGSRAWLVGLLTYWVVGDTVLLLMALRSMNNHWLIHAVFGLDIVFTFQCIALWQPTAISRRRVQLLMVGTFVWWAVTLGLLENLRSFSLLGQPVALIAFLAAALSTLLRRATRTDSGIWAEDWFWHLTGLALFAGVNAASTVFAALMLDARPDLASDAFRIKSYLEIVAFLLIGWGMALPWPESGSRPYSAPAAWRASDAG